MKISKSRSTPSIQQGVTEEGVEDTGVRVVKGKYQDEAGHGRVVEVRSSKLSENPKLDALTRRSRNA